MEYFHETVLREEALSVFLPMEVGVFLDGTVGGGGFAAGLLERAGHDVRLIGLDWDADAIAASRTVLSAFGTRAELFNRSYVEVEEVARLAGILEFRGMILDLGLSSALLEGDRGFSFRKAGPLDMRMDPKGAITAETLLKGLSVSELEVVLGRFGEIRGPGRLAAALKEAARSGRLRTTLDLAGVVRQVMPSSGSKMLARVFQSIRIAVNLELDNLERFLDAAPPLLAKGGRLAVISFHSLEDRVVKERFRDLAKTGQFRVGTKKPVVAGAEEVVRNQRSRSAKLRWIERVKA